MATKAKCRRRLIQQITSMTAAALWFTGAFAQSQGTAGVRQWTPTTAAADLAQGGHVIFLQHTASGESDRTSDCDSVDLLRDEGRAVARALGDGFRRLDIPVARIVSSEYCTAKLTANALELGDFSVDGDLNRVAENTNDAEQIGRLRRMISAETPEGSNILLVSHRSNINRLLNIDNDTAPGTVFSFRRVEGKITLVGSVKPEEWPKTGGGN